MTIAVVTAEEFHVLASRVKELEARLVAAEPASPWLTIPAAAQLSGIESARPTFGSGDPTSSPQTQHRSERRNREGQRVA